jgi:hypothetical protein
MKHLTLVLLAAFAFPVMAASINLNSSRSNAVEDADSAQTQGERLKHLDQRTQRSEGVKDHGANEGGKNDGNVDRAIKSGKSNSSDKFSPGGAQLGTSRLQGKPTKEQIEGDSERSGKGKLPGFERGTTVKGSKSNSDNRSIGSAVPDACKPNEFCASGQHFPQPLKK